MGLSLKLFGGFAVRDETGADLSLRTRKMRALLAYLAVNADKPQPRERLMALLWGDRDERQARPSLNNALMAIRRLGGHGSATLLDSDASQVTLRSAAVNCDVNRFRALLATDAAAAAELNDGPFLDGLSISEPAFEEWLTATRSALHAAVCDALQRAANDAARSGEIHLAIDAARRLVALDSLQEDGHRLLMRLLHESGDRVAALRQYRTCVDILARELNVEPDAATQTLYEEIRRDEQPSNVKTTASYAAGVVSSETGVWPDMPSIAVMPFESPSGDSDAKLFADGLSEDLITALTKVPDLFVISSHSTRNYRDKAISVQEVGRALDVRYVLEGGIRTHGDRLRGSVHLVDAMRGRHIWAERYDRQGKDIFSLQDEIVRHVLIELQVKLTEGDSARVASRGTGNLEAWLLRAQAAAELSHVTREGNARARDLFAAAHRADPNWARPLAGISSCDFYDARNRWSSSRDKSIEAGIEFAERAIAMDPGDPFGYVMLRLFKMLVGDYDEALKLIEKAVSIAPNDSMALGNLGSHLIWMDQIDKAIKALERVRRMAPIAPTFHQRYYGLALHIAGQMDRAVAVLEKLADYAPDYLEGLTQLAATYVSAGRIDSAQATVRKILAQDPAYTISDYLAAAIYFQDPKRTEWLRTLLVKAGLPG